MNNLLLLYGEEKLLIDEQIERIKNQIVPEGLQTVNFVIINGETATVDEIINACRTVPMMAESKLVLVTNARFFEGQGKNSEGVEIKKDKEDTLLKFIQDLPSYSFLVFVSKTVDKRKKLFKLIQEKGVVKEFPALPLKLKIIWVQKRLSLYGKKADLSEAAFIAQYTGSLYQTDSELKKIAAYMGDRVKVEKNDVDAVFTKTLENSIFDLTDYIGMKKTSQAISTFNKLLSQGEKSIIILHMISKQIMNMISVKLMAESDFNELRQLLGLHPFVLKKTIQQSKNFSLKELKRALALCQETDLNIKKGKIDEKTAVELLLVEISC